MRGAKKGRREAAAPIAPSRVFGGVARVWASGPRASSRNRPPVQRPSPAGVPRSSVPRSRSAVRHSAGFAVFPRQAAGPQLSGHHGLSSGFAFRECCPTQPSRPAAASQLLSWAFAPYSTCRARRSTSTRALPARFVPSSGFGYPLDGLLPPSPGQLCFTLAALLGFTLRSFLLPTGTRRVSACVDPHAVSSVGIPAAEAVGRPNGPRLLGFDPAGSPWRPDGG